MLIECPSCQYQARLSDSKEGAKVRCPECGRMFQALPKGARGRAAKQTDPTKYVIFGGAAAVGLVIVLLARNAGGKEEPVVEAAPAPVAEEPKKEDTGWDGPAMKAARDLHELAHLKNIPMLRSKLAGEHLWKADQAALAAASEEHVSRSWASLPSSERNAFLDGLALSMSEGELADLVAHWQPFQGQFITPDLWDTDYGQGAVVVRMDVMHRDIDAGKANRHVEWALMQERGSYKAIAWKRWFAPGEEEKGPTRPKKIVKRELSDGSKVIEGLIRAIPYADTTPQEQRDHIDGLIATLIDPETTRNSHLLDELEMIGKPAIPPLLTKLAEIPLESEEQAIQLNLVHRALTAITKYDTSFNAHESLGTTRERQESGLKQWFGWFDRKYKRFDTKPTPEVPEDEFADDPDFQPRSEAERRAIEKARREAGGGR